MKTKSILIALLVLMFTSVQAQINHFSLNSEDGNVVWKISRRLRHQCRERSCPRETL